MDHAQIETALRKLFEEEGSRLVFWNDPDREFDMYLPAIRIPEVTVVRLNEVGGLAAKILVEREQPKGKFLLYSPSEEPEYNEDWLLDVRLYSKNFRADRASIILNDLGLESQQLRQYVQDRRKFFDAKERVRKLKSSVAPLDTEHDLDRKMLAVIAKAEQPEWFTIVRTLFHALAEQAADDNGGLANFPTLWEQVTKFELEQPFWVAMKTQFGYTAESPSVKNLLMCMLATEFVQQLGETPAALSHFVLPRSGWGNVVVCLGQWRDSNAKCISYDKLAMQVGRMLNIEDLFHGREVEKLLDITTFYEAEKAILPALRDRVIATADAPKPEEIRSIATRRQDGHWANPAVTGAAAVPRSALHDVYDALIQAAEFFEMKTRYGGGFEYASAKAMYLAYEADLYRFDMLYRHFVENADRAELANLGMLKSLREQVESAYSNWYLPTLALAWGKFVGPEVGGGGGLMKSWTLEGIANQHQFYNARVRPTLDNEDYKRVFVIISDAFRYEAAQELLKELNGKYRLEAELNSQMSILPSYTALGMASLLPKKTLSYSEKGDVLVDGQSTASLEQRNDILAAVSGMAMKADDLREMKREEGRELVKDKRVVYLYHDVIDAAGDKQATEKDTFQAVRRAINEIAGLVGHIINNLNGNYVIVTADHGFLYAETAPNETGKSALSDKPNGTILAKRRYLLGRGLPNHDAAWHGRTEATANAEGGMEFWLPRGTNRFHFAGGSRYGHGGAMLQEVVVPVLTVRHVKGKGSEETKTKHAPVHVLGNKHKITTPRHRFELIQTEAVSERVRPVTLKVAVYEGTEPITNIETVTFDSKSSNMDERKKWVQLILKDRKYDKKAIYRLVLRDADSGVECESVDVVVDRAISDDF
jgi:uncharacterized protein (TIGR02687 family)